MIVQIRAINPKHIGAHGSVGWMNRMNTKFQLAVLCTVHLMVVSNKLPLYLESHMTVYKLLFIFCVHDVSACGDCVYEWGYPGKGTAFTNHG